jgi:preprotein translocase subunit Sec61beta
MTRKQKTYLPLGMGGLIRYGEYEESKIKIKPEHVVYILVGIGMILIFLNFLI